MSGGFLTQNFEDGNRHRLLCVSYFFLNYPKALPLPIKYNNAIRTATPLVT